MSKAAGNKDYDLKKAWDDACDAFAKTSGEELKVKTKYTPEEVLEQIRAKQEKDEEKAAKYRVVKDVLSKTLDCINSLGNIAAQGASMAFGPAGFAGNALSFLIATGAKYKYIFNSLAELFTKISTFLERFKIYFRMPDVDISLRVIINELLICFVSICGLSIKILKGNKALLYLKVFAFSDDAGVNGKLGELAALVEKEREMRATLGYEVEKNIERSVNAGRLETKEGLRALNSAVNEMAELEKKREATTLLAKQLDLIDKALDKPSDSYKSIYQNFMDKRVEGTGEWLLQTPEYSSWTQQEAGTSSVLCLVGGEGYGKSFLTSIAVQDLRKRFPPGEENSTRTSIAYYYFQREAKGSKSEKDVLSLNTALKSLAFQIAKIDTVYRKELHAVCESIEDLQVADLWKQLFEPALRSDATFYLILDGVDQMEEKHIKVFSQILQQALAEPADIKERGPLCIRILMSGKPKQVEEIITPTSATVVDVASNNRDDIEKFVRDGISDIKILDGSTPAAQARRDEIFEAITKHAKGDFISVDLLLKQIAEKRRIAEMLDVLEQFKGENRSETIARTIESLNKTLSRQDVLDLNELLVWVIASYQAMSLSELETVLRLKNGEDNYSLQPLAESIQERYSKVLTIEGEPDAVTKKFPQYARVFIISDSFQEYFMNMNEKQEGENSDGLQKLNKDGDVNESEVKIVRRFLESVCDPELFQRFQFEQFFQAKLTTSTATIQYDANDAHLRIVTACVDALLSEDTLWEPIKIYALDNFHYHLNALDLSLVLPMDKTVTGAKLVRCFTDEKVIAKWCQDDRIWLFQYIWVRENLYVDAVLNWLKDSAVVKGLTEEEKQFAKDLTSNSRPEADLIEHLAKYIAEQWLRNSYWDLQNMVLFLYSYVSKIEARIDPKRSDDWKTINFLESIKKEDIDLMLNWTKTKLGIEKLEYDEYRNLARTYRECGMHKQAIEMFKEGALMKEDNWLCRWGLSVAYRAEKEWTLAIETLEGVIASIKSGEAKVDDPESELQEMQRELAQCTKELGDTEKAIAMYQQIVLDSPEDYDTAYEFLTYLHESKKFVQLAALINSMKASIDEKSGLDRWTIFYHQFAQFSVYHETLASAGYEGGNLELVRGGYETAIEAARSKQKSASDTADRTEMENSFAMVVGLLYWFGVFLYRTQCVPNATRLAVTMWEQVLSARLTSRGRRNYYHYSMSRAQADISFAYLQLAKDAGPGSPVEAECIEKLRNLSKVEEQDYVLDTLSPKTALARYYSVLGRNDDAKEVMKGELKINLEMLSDDDPENDWQGYRGLADCFMSAGDFEQAQAAWSLITPHEIDGKLPELADKVSRAPVEEQSKDAGEGNDKEAQNVVVEYKVSENGSSSAEPSAQEENETSSEGTGESGVPESTTTPAETLSQDETVDLGSPFPGPMGASCDGRCGTSWQYSDGFYYCLDCSDVQFEATCLQKQRDGTLSRLVCNKNHEMFFVKKYDVKRLNEIGKGNVDVGGTIMSIKDWLASIKKSWGLEQQVVEEK